MIEYRLRRKTNKKISPGKFYPLDATLNKNGVNFHITPNKSACSFFKTVSTNRHHQACGTRQAYMILMRILPRVKALVFNIVIYYTKQGKNTAPGTP